MAVERVSCAGDRACAMPVYRGEMCRRHWLMCNDPHLFERSER